MLASSKNLLPLFSESDNASNLVIQYRCYERDSENLPSKQHHLVSANVTSLGVEMYFGVPTPTSLSIRVAHFMHDTAVERCDVLSPMGFTSTTVPELDYENEFAIL